MMWTTGRRNRLILVLLLVLTCLALLWGARGALFPYVFALLLAYLMLPAVNWLSRIMAGRFKRPRLTRPIAILLVYLLTAALVALFVAVVVPVVTQQLVLLWADRSELLSRTQELSSQALAWYRENVPADIQTQVDEQLRKAGGTIVSAAQTGLMRTLGVVTTTVGFILAMVVVPFWLFYILQDQPKFARLAVESIAPRYRADALNLVRIIDGNLGSYLRGQLLLCIFIGILVTVGLTLIGVRFPAALGLLAGTFEILPFIGPILGLVPALAVAVIQSPLLALWTLIMFLGIQQVENIFLVPRVSGKAVQLHPAVIMLVLVVGNEVAGLWGMILAVPLTAIIRDTFKYLYWRFQDVPLDPADALGRLRSKTTET